MQCHTAQQVLGGSTLKSEHLHSSPNTCTRDHNAASKESPHMALNSAMRTEKSLRFHSESKRASVQLCSFEVYIAQPAIKVYQLYTTCFVPSSARSNVLRLQFCFTLNFSVHSYSHCSFTCRSVLLGVAPIEGTPVNVYIPARPGLGLSNPRIHIFLADPTLFICIKPRTRANKLRTKHTHASSPSRSTSQFNIEHM